MAKLPATGAPYRVRVQIPFHLQNLAQTGPEIELELMAKATVKDLVRVLEQRYPMLRGAILEHGSGKRRPLIRFFACSEDVSTEIDHTFLPQAVLRGHEPFMIVGAIAGG